MTVYGHAKICLGVCALALISVALGLFPQLSATVGREYVFGAAAALIGGFLVREYMLRQEATRLRGDHSLDDLPPALTHAVLMTIWIPVMLGVAAVFLLSWGGIAPQKVSWILVAIAGMCGQHLANVKNLRTDR